MKARFRMPTEILPEGTSSSIDDFSVDRFGDLTDESMVRLMKLLLPMVERDLEAHLAKQTERTRYSIVRKLDRVLRARKVVEATEKRAKRSMIGTPQKVVRMPGT